MIFFGTVPAGTNIFVDNILGTYSKIATEMCHVSGPPLFRTIKTRVTSILHAFVTQKNSLGIEGTGYNSSRVPVSLLFEIPIHFYELSPPTQIKKELLQAQVKRDRIMAWTLSDTFSVVNDVIQIACRLHDVCLHLGTLPNSMDE